MANTQFIWVGKKKILFIGFCDIFGEILRTTILCPIFNLLKKHLDKNTNEFEHMVANRDGLQTHATDNIIEF